MTRIILLDVDGVLVQPGGYRAALRATVQRFIGGFTIEEDLLIDLEKRGIFSEWDMSPLIIASYWNSILAQQPMPNLPDDVSAAARQIQIQRKVEEPKQVFIPEFKFVTGQYPAETAFHVGCFSFIPVGLRRNLLSETRNVHKSETMRVFQHFSLGSKAYAEAYQLSAEFEAESFLLKYDHSNVDDSIRAALFRDGNHLAAFTARPSAAPCEVTGSIVGYAPEAELALELVQMQDIPLIGFGKLEYIAAQHGLDPAIFIKPSPFQALAGILAAWTGEELPALQAAYDWHSAGMLNEYFDKLPKSFELVAVEDTLSGIRSAIKAGKILQEAGLDVTIRPFGLTSGNSAKAAVFQQARIPFFAYWRSLIHDLDR